MFIIYMNIGTCMHLSVFLLNPYFIYVYAHVSVVLEMSRKLLLLS